MTVIIKFNNQTDCFANKKETFLNVWEIQDNDTAQITLKFHNHECIFINKNSIEQMNIESMAEPLIVSNPCIKCKHHVYLVNFNNEKEWECAYIKCKYGCVNVNPKEPEVQ